MGVIKAKAPQKKDLRLPVCDGCSKCGDLRPDALYALGYDNKYYCVRCFHRIAVRWPKPGIQQTV